MLEDEDDRQPSLLDAAASVFVLSQIVYNRFLRS